MVLTPDKHSPEIYKASIMQILGKQELAVAQTPVIEDVTEVEIPDEIIDEIPEIIETPNITKEEASKEKLRQHLLSKYQE